MTITMTSIAFFLLLLLSSSASAADNDNAQIHSDKSQLASWFRNGIQNYKLRTTRRWIQPYKNGGGNFNTVMAAVNSVPASNTQHVIIWIGGGEYEEKIKIDRNKPFITFYGSPEDMQKLSFDGTAAKFGTVDSATLIVESDYFMAVNIIVINSSPRPDRKRKGAQAVALRESGDKAAFYNCRLIGFQDTRCDDRGRHFFHGCYVEGNVDCIFGSSKSLYLDNGYSFVHCTLSGTGGNTFLWRAWMSRPRVVFSYTFMTSVVSPLGWSDNIQPEHDSLVFYGEYKCMGPEADASKRPKFTKELNDNGARPFITLNYIDASTWLLPPPSLALR
ncbi:hypothetical protein PVL29_020757 [Vitis rotundifolia]|uniref:pectinesterase n=1 Tax=Vitis rotundifolia TaxID=103349 RepID=A0AA39DCF9_VITRO|nr:hypothetical protein PVL29_020757 [Vitis rotundifolia]